MYTRIGIIRFISEKKKYVCFVVYYILIKKFPVSLLAITLDCFCKQKFQLFLEHIGGKYGKACDIGI